MVGTRAPNGTRAILAPKPQAVSDPAMDMHGDVCPPGCHSQNLSQKPVIVDHDNLAAIGGQKPLAGLS